MSNEVMWDPNPAGGLGPTPKSRKKRELRVTTSATPDEVDSIADLLGITSLRYSWALIKSSDNNNASNPVEFAHNVGAGFDKIYAGGVYVDQGVNGQVLNFSDLYVKSASASQELFIEYLEP